jgi:hypothetical protein
MLTEKKVNTALSRAATPLLPKPSLLLATALSPWDMRLDPPVLAVMDTPAEDSKLPTSSGLSLPLPRTSTMALVVTRAKKVDPSGLF